MSIKEALQAILEGNSLAGTITGLLESDARLRSLERALKAHLDGPKLIQLFKEAKRRGRKVTLTINGKNTSAANGDYTILGVATKRPNGFTHLALKSNYWKEHPVSMVDSGYYFELAGVTGSGGGDTDWWSINELIELVTNVRADEAAQEDNNA